MARYLWLKDRNWSGKGMILSCSTGLHPKDTEGFRPLGFGRYSYGSWSVLILQEVPERLSTSR